MSTAADLSPITDIFRQIKSEISVSKVFLETERESLSYKQTLDRIARLATLFEQMHLSRGDRVLVSSEDDAAVAILVLALIGCGITAVPVNPQSSADEFRNMIAKAEVKAVFADREIVTRNRLSGESESYQILEIVAEETGSLFDRFRKKKAVQDEALTYPALLKTVPPTTALPGDISSSTSAYVLFTSGTTSEPKGVEITHANLFANFETLQNQYRITADTRWLNILPLHHADGLVQGPLLCFCIGGTCFRPMTFHLEQIGTLLDQIYKLRITHWLTVPTVLALTAEFGSDFGDAFDTPDFEFVISTAGYLDETIWQRFEDRFRTRVVNVYGLTETVCEAFYCGPDDHTRRLGTIGKPLDVDTRIVNEDGTHVAPGEVGELLLRGDNIMKGYLNMPAATAAVMNDGWFSTGDLVRVDGDGFYLIVGRKKNIIISGGLNVYPEDVASVLRTIEGVIDAAVFGVEDERWGEKVAACVEINAASGLTTQALRAQFLQKASGDMLPHEIVIANELPRGPSGKVIIEQARQLLHAAKQVSYEGGADELENRIMATAAQVFDVSPGNLSAESDRKNTESWTSLAQVDLILSIEKEFNFRMPSRDVMTIQSLRNIIDIVRKQTS